MVNGGTLHAALRIIADLMSIIATIVDIIQPML